MEQPLTIEHPKASPSVQLHRTCAYSHDGPRLVVNLFHAVRRVVLAADDDSGGQEVFFIASKGSKVICSPRDLVGRDNRLSSAL